MCSRTRPVWEAASGPAAPALPAAGPGILPLRARPGRSRAPHSAGGQSAGLPGLGPSVREKAPREFAPRPRAVNAGGGGCELGAEPARPPHAPFSREAPALPPHPRGGARPEVPPAGPGNSGAPDPGLALPRGVRFPLLTLSSCTDEPEEGRPPPGTSLHLLLQSNSLEASKVQASAKLSRLCRPRRAPPACGDACLPCWGGESPGPAALPLRTWERCKGRTESWASLHTGQQTPAWPMPGVQGPRHTRHCAKLLLQGLPHLIRVL